MIDYGDDPMKALVRKYDRAVVQKGGGSLFAIKGWRRLPAYSRDDGRVYTERWSQDSTTTKPIDARGELPGNAAHNVSKPVESVSVRHAQQHARRSTDETGNSRQGPGNV